MCSITCGAVLLVAMVMVSPISTSQAPDMRMRQNLPSSNVQVHYNLTNSVESSEDTTTTELSESTTDTSEVSTGTGSTEATNPCNCVCGIPNRRHRIVGGNISRVNEFPWIASLSRRGRFYCGAALITRRHVLTAAHCIEGFALSDIQVTLGDHDRSTNDESASVVKRVVSAKVHANFSIFTFNNDVAVLELDSPVELGESVRTACLPRQTRDVKEYNGLMAVVAGWGRVEEKKPTSDLLRKVAVPIMTMEDCRKSGYVASRITDNMICAGYPKGKKDACQGDSGGPMHLAVEEGYFEVIGVVSWGRGCARPNFPGIYTRLVNYLDWVADKIGDECVCPPLH